MIADFSYAYARNSLPLSVAPFWPSRARTN